MRILISLATVLIFLCMPARAAFASDGSPGDAAHPAGMQSLQIPSHGFLMNGFVYLASGAGPHPTAVLLHGLPGNERSLDIGQAMRRAGWNVLFFNYRGSWGTAGDFSFTHCVEDAEAVVAWLREPETSMKLRADPARILLLGHSMGGFVANETAANTPGLLGVITISAVDLNAGKVVHVPVSQRETVAETMAPRIEQQGLSPLRGCSGTSLALDILTNAPQWVFPSLAARLVKTPYLLFTSDDGWTEANDTFAAALQKAGNAHVTTIHLATDHFYSDERLTLEQDILAWTAKLN